MVPEHYGDVLEYSFTCPYCWQQISMVIEPSAEIQSYIEDCEVCCQPIQISFRKSEEGGELEFFAEGTQL